MSTRARRVPTELAALVLGVQEVTIRQWARRGKITRYGTARRALYDLDELTELARTTTPASASAPTATATPTATGATATATSSEPAAGSPAPHN
ncbi:transcriptional regulator [Streptomyces sp. NPDC127077]|uniref:transcriptional regulator n=1 Tax=Streptomyces sp. NPDC127077 TaxID=3347131 RepID=UPI00365D9E9F